MKVERPRARSSAAPTRENSRSTTPSCALLRRHERAHLRQHGDQRVLAQEGRFAGHVRAGEEPDFACIPRRRDRSALATNGVPSRASACSTTGWRPPSITKLDECIDLGPHIVALGRQHSQRGRYVEHRQRLRALLDRLALREHLRGQSLERVELDAERAVGGGGDLGLQLAELGGREAHLAGQRLAVDEGRIERRRHQLVAVLLRHLDEIAEHIVVLDLQRLDAGLVGIARLQRGYRPGGIRHAARGPHRAPAS